ncbi:hypothetical protein ACQEUU_14640 [Nonomuraea sp. CA-218870]|uniref:hypothetical protein n=1 Tax=Nonomuraea sp. CA-218870 TaxID=3239998 RepID=UPI003D916249
MIEKPTLPRPLPSVVHRWPTLLGLVFAAVGLAGGGDGRGSAFVVFAAAFIYLAAAVLDRPGSAWVLFVVSLVVWPVLNLLPVEPWPGLVGGAVTLILLGLAGGLPRKPALIALQVPAMAVFGGAAVLALSLPAQAGGLLVAAALIGHAAHDLVVLRAKQVVAVSMAEFCLVLDLVLGLGLVVLALWG